jgi:ribosomal protein S12 methylthiotransferase accessory factor YcaO
MKRPIHHSENGQRSVPLERTIQDIERFFLKNPMEVQFAFVKPKIGKGAKACLKYHAPSGPSDDHHYFGKGLSAGQNFTSACFEFFERYSAKMLPDDLLIEASYAEVSNLAIDPRELILTANSSYAPSRKISWIWGFSLSRNRNVLVPANLVFLPFIPRHKEKIIALEDSNGIASGNNREEAILHALLEVVERDQVIISEYNLFPFIRIAANSLPDACRPIVELIKEMKFDVHIFAGISDIPIPFMATYLESKNDPSTCSVAYGSYLDPTLAVERALTEAVQLLPPAVNGAGWKRWGRPRFFRSQPALQISLDSMKNRATADIKKNIERCISILAKIGSEVVVVDLPHPEIPFPTVRILATGLQPILRKNSMRLSRRFFEVPIKLGFRRTPFEAPQVKIWPICGYK